MFGNFLLILVMAIFVGMVFINVYFRLKVLKVYQRLRRSGTDIAAAHIFNREKLEKEVLIKHPQHKDDILTFVNNIRYSVKMASILIVLITLFAAILMFWPFN